MISRFGVGFNVSGRCAQPYVVNALSLRALRQKHSRAPRAERRRHGAETFCPPIECNTDAFPGIDAALSRARRGSQRAVIRRALAEMAPLGQKTVRGSLNEISQDADEVCPDAVPGSP